MIRLCLCVFRQEERERKFFYKFNLNNKKLMNEKAIYNMARYVLCLDKRTKNLNYLKKNRGGEILSLKI